jgi:hypothetical protein
MNISYQAKDSACLFVGSKIALFVKLLLLVRVAIKIICWLQVSSNVLKDAQFQTVIPANLQTIARNANKDSNY